MPNNPTQPQQPQPHNPQPQSTEQQLVMFLQSLEQQLQDLSQRVDALEGKNPQTPTP